MEVLKALLHAALRFLKWLFRAASRSSWASSARSFQAKMML